MHVVMHHPFQFQVLFNTLKSVYAIPRNQNPTKFFLKRIITSAAGEIACMTMFIIIKFWYHSVPPYACMHACIFSFMAISYSYS